MEPQPALLTPLLELVNSATHVLQSELQAAQIPEPWLSNAQYHRWDEETPSKKYWDARRELMAALSMMMALVQNPRERLAGVAWAYMQNSALHTVAKARVADILSSPDVDPTRGLHVDEIAKRCDMSSSKLCHVLRHLSVHHMFEERSPSTFANNRLSIGLKSTDTARGNIMFFSGYAYHSAPFFSSNLLDPVTAHSVNPTDAPLALYWNELTHNKKYVNPRKPSAPSLSTPAAKTDIGQIVEPIADSDSDNLHKPTLALFDLLGLPTNAEHRANLANAMITLESMNGRKGFMDFDWQRFDVPGAVIVEAGSSAGHLSLAVLPTLKHATFVNQDLPEVCEEGEKFFATENPEAIRTGRVSFQPNDFFTGQPIRRASVYILSNIVHDWQDAEAMTILHHIVEAMTSDSRLLVIEAVMEPALSQHALPRPTELSQDAGNSNASSQAPWPLLTNYGHVNSYAAGQSLALINALNSLDRTLPEYVALFEKTGLILVKVHRIRKVVSIMELKRAHT